MNRTYDKSVLPKAHYKTDEKLVLRKKYNSFAVPRTNLDELLIKKIRACGAKCVLDVGCGNGDFLIELRKSGFDGELMGLDISPGIQKPGIKQNEKEKLGIKFMVGDAEQLPFEDNTFDAIIAKHMLYHLPTPQKGADEIYRCLKKGGLVIITLNSTRNTPLLHECEHFICNKYALKSEHGQDIVNMETIQDYLTKFTNIHKEYKEGKINKPDLFPAVFESFRDNYEPQPNDALWAKIMADVNAFVKDKIMATGAFIETRSNGLVIAHKD